MEMHGGQVERLSHFLHKNLLWLLLGSYAVAAAWPEPGLKARSVSVGEVALFHERVNLSLPVLMLAACCSTPAWASRSLSSGGWLAARRRCWPDWPRTC